MEEKKIKQKKEEEEQKLKLEKERQKFEEEQRKIYEEEIKRKEEEIRRKEEEQKKEKEIKEKYKQDQKKLQEKNDIILQQKKEYERQKLIEEQKKLEIDKEKFNQNMKKLEEEMRRKKEKESLILRQNKNIYNNNFFLNYNNNDSKKTEEINQILEDMCIYGNIVKKKIEEETKLNPNKFIPKSQALNSEEIDEGLFALGLLSQNLENLGIKTVIEKDENNYSKNDDEYTTSLQFIINGLCDKKKYTLKFDFGEDKNEELLNNKEKYEIFKNNLKKKISRDYNVPIEKIIVTYPQRGSFEVQLIFQSDEFNELSIQEFLNKFQNENEFTELRELKEIHQNGIIEACRFTKNQLDPRGNRKEGWGEGEKRGNRVYNPPKGWTGIGLKVFDKYDNGNNTWIGMKNSPGEWCVAYHGVGRNCNPETIKKIIKKIYIEGFQQGPNQMCSKYMDLKNPGKTVGVGVYCTPKIEVAERFSGISEINGKRYRTVFMVRVNPDKIRFCQEKEEYWVVKGSSDEIRPYRILYKKV